MRCSSHDVPAWLEDALKKKGGGMRVEVRRVDKLKE